MELAVVAKRFTAYSALVAGVVLSSEFVPELRPIWPYVYYAMFAYCAWKLDMSARLSMLIVFLHSLTHYFISNSLEAIEKNSTLDIGMHTAINLYVHWDLHYTGHVLVGHRRYTAKPTNFILNVFHLGNVISGLLSMPWVTAEHLDIFRYSTIFPAYTSAVFIAYVLVRDYTNSMGAFALTLFGTTMGTIATYLWMLAYPAQVDMLLGNWFFDIYFMGVYMAVVLFPRSRKKAE